MSLLNNILSPGPSPGEGYIPCFHLCLSQSFDRMYFRSSWLWIGFVTFLAQWNARMCLYVCTYPLAPLLLQITVVWFFGFRCSVSTVPQYLISSYFSSGNMFCDREAMALCQSLSYVSMTSIIVWQNFHRESLLLTVLLVPEIYGPLGRTAHTEWKHV